MVVREITTCSNGAEGCDVECGGTLLNSRHVLTAAHCIQKNNASALLIIGGTHNKRANELEKQQSKRVQQIFIHPGWDRKLIINDMAIVRLSEPMQYTRSVQPACLPGPDPRVNSTVVAIGWGNEALDGPVNSVLKQTHMNVVSNCSDAYSNLGRLETDLYC